jgi:hypothetical protein
MKIHERLLSLGALALLFAAVASADTIELKDGRTLRGKYLGGTQVIIRFEIEGDVQTFRVAEVSVVTFDRHRRSDAQDQGGMPPASPDQGAPPPNNQPTANSQPAPGDQGAPTDAPPPAASTDTLPADQSRPNDAPPPPPEQGRPGDYPPPPPDSRDRDGRDRSRYDDQDRDRDTRQLVYAAPGPPITLPAGQAILVRMIDEVDSKHDEVGDPFHASLQTDLAVNNVLVARRGSDVYGRLAYAKEAGHLSGNAELQLELTRIIIDGKEFPVVTGEYTLKGSGRGGDTARKVGGGAVLGAIIGGVAGGGAGAAIGAGVGGAAGAGVQIATRGHQVKVPSETLLEFRLDQPATVTPTQK